MNRVCSLGVLCACLASGAVPGAAPRLGGGADERSELTANVKQALDLFNEADDTLASDLSRAAGYAVFPSVGKVGVGVGGARGTGQLMEDGAAIGETTLTQASIGFQLGGQVYAELIVFENRRVLDDFKKGNFELSAQLSAVAAASGASKNAKFDHGMKVLTLAKKGLMAEASVGGQKFGFKAYQ